MLPTSTNPVEANYSANAAAYSQFLQTPLGQLERDLFSLSITACSGMHVLDLGGGTGLRARDALAAGARSVDVVDISPAMMELGKQHEASIGRDAINWYHADVSKPLDHLGLGPYDMVIANGIFDHAHDEAELEGMWANAAAYLKEGGKIVANRNDPFSRAAREGKYGVRFTDFEEVEGGVRYHYRTVTEPALDFESWALEAYVKKPFEIAGRFFEGFENVDWDETEVVKRDREFWREYLEEPILYIFTARKGMGRS
jgi:SAM-dependent methyltransferase